MKRTLGGLALGLDGTEEGTTVPASSSSSPATSAATTTGGAMAPNHGQGRSSNPVGRSSSPDVAIVRRPAPSRKSQLYIASTNLNTANHFTGDKEVRRPSRDGGVPKPHLSSHGNGGGSSTNRTSGGNGGPGEEATGPSGQADSGSARASVVSDPEFSHPSLPSRTDSKPSFHKYLATISGAGGGASGGGGGGTLDTQNSASNSDSRSLGIYSGPADDDDMDSDRGPRINGTLEEAFNKGNVAYTTCVCGVLSALVEFCIRQRRDAARRILELHPELMRSVEHLIPNAGVTLAGTKHTITAQEYDAACKTLYAAKRDIQIADAFELRDIAKLEMLYSGGLKTGIIEACRRNEYAIARRLCYNLYVKTPSYRLTRIGSFTSETVSVQRMLDKLHEDVCRQCEEEDAVRQGKSRTCTIL